MARQRPVGAITRGTTGPNRLRRADRWLTGPAAAVLRRSSTPPVVVDLGFGASAVTTLELFERLRTVRPDVEVIGIEIDPARVRAAAPLARPGLSFALGGFELALERGARPVVVRAFNVLRQYDEQAVPDVWRQVQDRLAPGGLFVDGTSDEAGRLATWVGVDVSGPQTLTLSMRLGGLTRPSTIAERLPKTLIHRNVPGERVHAVLTALDQAWARAAPHASYGARQRFLVTVRALAEQGWDVRDGPARWRLGELTVGWATVAPRSSV